jgi:hypothetical protein
MRIVFELQMRLNSSFPENLATDLNCRISARFRQEDGFWDLKQRLGRGADVRLDRSISEEQPGLRVVHRYQRIDDPSQLDSSNAQEIESR